jgi:predicted AAA+ superfamily ATPase
MIIERELEHTIAPYLESPEAVVVTGMRRAGKTTLLQSLHRNVVSENKLFLDLENPLHQKYFEDEDYEKVRSNLEVLGLNLQRRTYLFLDEIQLVRRLPSIVKYLSDHYPIKFLLTGSSSFYLKNLFTESLAGRKVLFTLFPLSFREFLSLKGETLVIPPVGASLSAAVFALLSRHYDEYIRFGGFPGVVSKESAQAKKRALEDIFTSYYQQEVVQLGDFRRVSLVRDCMLLLLARVGSKVDVQKLASELGVSRPTVYEYLAFLEGTYFITLVKPWSSSRDVSVRGAGKVYAIDSGLLGAIANVSDGVLFEQTVFQALRQRGIVHHYTKGRTEVDFILNGEHAFEAKLRATEKDARHLHRITNALGLKSAQMIARERSALPNVLPAWML